MSRSKLQNVEILVADPDTQLSAVLTHNLRTLGFGRVHLVRDGAQAMQALQVRPIDIFITEWGLGEVDGIKLLQHLRMGKASPNRTLPVVMLTGRGEQPDVETARDSGINEFVLKPFTAKTVYTRLEQIIDRPRNFLLSRYYTGPCRRRKWEIGEEGMERRHLRPLEIAHSQAADVTPGDGPVVIRAETTIKKNIGLTGPLSRLITPEVLRMAQAAIDSMSAESLDWIRQDIESLEKSVAHQLLDPEAKMQEPMKTAALSIKSRAGTFGYRLASDVARLLYLFLCTDYKSQSRTHNEAVLKYIEALKVIIAHKITADSELGMELKNELERLSAYLRRG